MQKIFILLATAVSVAYAPIVNAESSIATVPAAQAGLSEQKLDAVTTLIQDYVSSGRLAGATTLVSRKGKIAHFQTYGRLDETGKKMPEDAVFTIHSMTKPITGVALMMLHEEGKFKLDDPISKYLPSFANQRVFSGVNEDGSLQTVPVKHEATVMDLMRHTAGLTYGVFGNTPVDQAYLASGVFDPSLTLAEQTAKLGKLPLLYQPGDAWVYSLAVDVQGRLVEVLSGQTFDAFLKERIFDPLGMNDTGFFVREDQRDRFVEVYAPNENKELSPYRGNFYSDYSTMPKAPSGGGGLVSTTMDYWKFAQMVANGGELNGVRLLKQETVDNMHTNHLPKHLEGIFTGEQRIGFGLDFGIVQDVSAIGAKSKVGEYFWGGMANTIFWIDPTDDVIAIFMTSILPSGLYPLRNELRDRVYDAVVTE